MKDIKDYVCTLKQAKKLKELGVEQDSLFWFAENAKKLMILKNIEKKQLIDLTVINDDITVGSKYYFYSAFTSQELGELIDKNIKNEHLIEHSIQTNEFRIYNINYAEPQTSYIDIDLLFTSTTSTEAQARADYFIYLLENNKSFTGNPYPKQINQSSRMVL